MTNKFQLLKKKFLNFIIMPKDIKSKVIERNLKIQIRLSAIICIFSVLTLLPLLIAPNNKGPEVADYIFHYSAMAIIQLVTFILGISSKKIKILRKSNVLILLNFIGLAYICYRIFNFGVIPFNSLIIFVCLSTLFLLVFTIEPIYYFIITGIFGILICPRFIELYGQNSATNGLIYLLIMTGLAVSRWFYIKSNIIYDRKSKEREKQIHQELEMAATVQKSFYHHNLTNVKEWDVAYYNNPMLSVSGDLFDFFVRKSKLEGLCIFDVSGHGLASSLVTMLVKNTMEEEFYDNEDIEFDFTMRRINKRVSEEKGDIENYLTGIMLRFKDDIIEMVNAGHPIPIIYNSSTNTCNYLKYDIKDMQGAIGLSDFDFDFKTLEIKLEVKDRIILYTDGVTEAKNQLNDQYGKTRFLESVQKHCNLNVKDQIAAIVNDIKEFIGAAPQSDDISIIIMEKK